MFFCQKCYQIVPDQYFIYKPAGACLPKTKSVSFSKPEYSAGGGLPRNLNRVRFYDLGRDFLILAIILSHNWFKGSGATMFPSQIFVAGTTQTRFCRKREQN